MSSNRYALLAAECHCLLHDERIASMVTTGHVSRCHSIENAGIVAHLVCAKALADIAVHINFVHFYKSPLLNLLTCYIVGLSVYRYTQAPCKTLRR